ncbi:N-acetyltransferase [Actinomadura graeca]|uniref:N-acetyltransferase n=1 Tax=Actinomadura graeca TaxID=2750812 RepID=A0ABX8R764_9ACTN|nr:GNAT family N-acetyltransferase [Actinomadura graeca]QXJ24818.1 N-acetyltransferase [Actinomadura graeca]
MGNEITDDAARGRYEIRVDGDLAGFAEYETRPGQVVLTHTEVDGAFEGQGVGSALARGVLDDVRAKGLTVVPRCPFIRTWIDKHPDYRDLVAA